MSLFFFSLLLLPLAFSSLIVLSFVLIFCSRRKVECYPIYYGDLVKQVEHLNKENQLINERIVTLEQHLHKMR